MAGQQGAARVCADTIMSSTSTIAVDELRVGMYIHLDGGWLSHPFPLSSFRIGSAEDIATLRKLGLQQVRWSPDKSDTAPARGAAANDAPEAAAPAAAEPQPQLSAEELAARQRTAWLAAQRAAAQLCERQYAEAGRAWRQCWESVAAQPQQAGRTAEALTRAMLDKLLAAEDVGIRLIHGGGDRSAAHALNVTVVSLLIARTLGMEDADMLDLGVGALLHDVGKQDLPDRLRHAEEGFSGAEMALYRDHVGKGVHHARRMGLGRGALEVVAQHHEHADGTGFPARLSGDRMPLASRIVTIVNRYDNLCNPATRAQALTPHEAVATLFAQGRSRYDAAVLNAFIRMMGVYPAGSLVQLTDDRYGLVVGVNSSRPLKPRVLVHGAGAKAGEAALVDLETQPDVGIRRSLPPAKLPPAVLAALDPRPRVVYYFEPLARAERSAELAA